MDIQKRIGRLFGRSKQDAEKKVPNVQEEVDAAEPPTDPASTPEPSVVSATFADEMTPDIPDRSVENAARIVNDLAFNNVSKSSPKISARGKRRRQEGDVVDAPPMKRLANGARIEGATDEPPTTSIIDTTGQRTVKVAPGKLPRPKKEQRRRLMVESYPAVQKSGDIWDPTPSPEKQVEKSASPLTTPTTRRTPPSSKATPRPRGRPPRVGPASIKQTASIKHRQQRIMQDLKVKPPRKGRPGKYVSPEVESQEGPEISVEILPRKLGPNPRPKLSEKNNGERAQTSKLTRSTAAATGHKDAILNAVTDLTKKPERDARRAAKGRKKLEQASESTAAIASNGGQEDVASDFDIGPRPRDHIVREEHEEEEEEPERPTRIGPEGAADSDSQSSFQMDAGDVGGAEDEEEDSDLESLPRSIETDEWEGQGKEKLELFGQDEAWKSVIEGARSICGRNLLLNHMPKLRTETIRDLVRDVQEARGLYEQHHDPLDGPDDQLGDDQSVDSQLRKSLYAIDDLIRRLSERNATNKSSEMITDIFTRAIPAMVFLLQSALASRLYHSDEPCDLRSLNRIVKGLEEVVHLQDMVILLCMKARSWKAKPGSTSRPVIKPTTQKMYPNLKVMRKAFDEKLSELKRRRKVKQNAVDSRKRQIELAHSFQQESQEAARRNEILQRRIKESREEEDKKRRQTKRSYRRLQENQFHTEKQSQQVDDHVESTPLWSYDEEVELYYELEKGYVARLTTEERYLKILNNPLLQDKLPKHIHERALYIKPFLLDEKGALEWISSIE